jgi:hypothetical protein
MDGGSSGDYHELFKVFSRKTLMITNTRIADRRKKGWDIGLPYLSVSSRVYHFDTDLNDQNQASNLEISYTGAAPALADKDQTNGQIYLNPAVLDTAPHEMKRAVPLWSVFGKVKAANSNIRRNRDG